MPPKNKSLRQRVKKKEQARIRQDAAKDLEFVVSTRVTFSSPAHSTFLTILAIWARFLGLLRALGCFFVVR